MANRIDFEVGYKIDQASLNQLKSALQAVQQQAKGINGNNPLKQQFDEAAASARELEKILDSAWNSKLGQLNLSKVNESIRTTYGSVEQMRAAMVKGGETGAAAYNKVASSILNTNLQLKNSNKLLDDMATTMKNTVKWGITSSVFNNLTSQIQKAWSFTKNLDSSLNDIRIVTEKSADQMERFARVANQGAKELGASTLDYTNASLIYYQQGLADAEVQARAETTLKAANVTGQTGEAVSEQLTAVWNGYKVSAAETELYVDKLAAVAATTASDLEELSVGMSKVASAANSMGVDVDQLNAQIATIISVTRQAPESVGTALKTIYARMGDLSIDGEDEFGTKLGDVSGKMEQMGIQVLDQTGNLRDMGTVIEEVAAKWDTWTEAQRQAAAVALAGKRQYNNLVALFDNWGMYTEALETSANAAGTLQDQQDIYMESTEAHLQQLRTESQRTYDIIFNQDTVNGFTDALTGTLTVFNNFLDGLGGGGNALLHFGAIATAVFSQQIGNSLAQSLHNLEVYRNNLDAVVLKENIASQHALSGDSMSAAGLREELKVAQQIQTVRKGLTQQEYEELTALQKQVGIDQTRIAYLSKYKDISLSVLDTAEASVYDYKERLRIEQETLDTLEQQRFELVDANRLYKEVTDNAVELDLVWDAIKGISQNTQLTEEERIQIEEVLYNIAENESVTEQDIQTVLTLQNQTIERQRALVGEINQGLEGREALENGELQRLMEQQRARKALIDQTTQEAQARKTMQDGVKGLAAAASLITTSIGLVKTLTDETATAGEKVERVVTTLTFSLPMLITNFSSLASIGPMITSGLVSIAKSLGVVGLTADATAAQAIAGIFSVQTALGPLGWVIMAITAAVAALSAAIYIGVKAYNTDANAAKEAAQASKEAAQAAEEAKTAYEDLASAFGAYDDAVTALEELERGTDEWADALKEANDAAMNLIKTNSSLAQYASRNADGLIVFAEEAQSVVEAAKAMSQMSVGAANLAQITANEASLKSQRTNLARSESIGEWRTDTEGGSYFVRISDEQMQAVIASIQENGGLLESDLHKIDALHNNQELISSIMSAEDELVNLAQTTSDLNATNRLLLGDSIRTSLEQNEDYASLNTAEQNAFAALYQEQFLSEEVLQNIRDQAHDELYNDWAFGWGNEDDIHDQFAKARGWSFAEDKWGDKAVYVDQEGNEHTVTDDAARAWLENLEVQEAIGQKTAENEEEYEKLLNLIQDIDSKAIDFGGEEYGEALGNSILSGIANGTHKFDFSQIYEKLDPTQIAELENLSEEDLMCILGLTEEDLITLGWNSARTFKASWDEALGEYDTTTYWNRQYNNSSQNAASMSAIIDASQGHEELDDQSQELLDELIDKYEKLDEVRQASGHEYLEILKDIQEAEEDAAETAAYELLKAAQEKVREAQSTIDAINQARSMGETWAFSVEGMENAKQQLQDALDQVANAQYQITVEVNADLATDVEQAFSLADEFGDLQDMLSETLEITFAEAEEIIANGYGAILENARETADQTIILDAEVADAFIAHRQEELHASKEAKIQLLEGERTLLETQRNLYDQKIEALTVAANAETQTEAATALAAAKLLDQEIAYNQAALEAKMTNTEEANEEISADETRLAEFMADVDENIATNAGLAATSAQQSSAALAKASIDDANQVGAAWQAAWQAMESGEFTPSSYAAGSKPDASSNFTASVLGSSYEQTERNLEDLTGKILAAADNQVDVIRAEAQRQLEVAQQERAAIDAQIGAIDAGIAALKSSEDSLNEARRTAGTKEPGSKSGSSKKEKDPDHMDYLDDEIDKYHDINNELKQIAANLKLIQGQEDKYIRAGLTYNLEKQLEVLKQQEDAQRRKLALAQADLKAQAALLQAKGVQIGEDGQILNYAGILAAKQAEINALIAEYNGLSAADQEGYKDVIEQKKQEYEQLKSQMAAYDTLLNDTIPNLISDIQDTIDAQIEAQIKKFNVMIEAHLDIKDLEEEWNKFKAKVILDLDDDDYIGKAQNAMERFYNYYRSNGTGIVQELTKHVNDIADQIRQIEATGTSSIYGDNEAQAMEDLRKYNTELMNSLEEIKDLEEEVYDDYLDLIDKAQDAFDQQVETYEQISDIIEHDMELTRLLWGDDAYDTLDKYYTMQEQNNNQQLDFLRQQADMWKNLMDNEEEGSEAWEKYRDNWMSAVSDLNSLVEDSVQNLLDKYANTMSKIIDDLNKKITGGKGLDYVSEEWDLINREADQYLDTINAGYAIQKLENEINQSLTDLQGNVAAQQALNKLRDEELQKLKDKEKITEYDVERAELMYQIALKQIALEQAQQNKSSMRLRRDSQGNYTYQYVADDNQIAEAQQALNEAQNNLFNLDKDAYRENLDNIYEIYNEFQEKVLELYQDMTLSDEEREEKKALYAEYYGNLINNLVTENEYIRLNLMDSTFQSLAELYNQDVENFYNMSQAEQDELINSIVPQWNTSIQQMADEFAGEGGFIPTCQEAFMQLDETTQYYRQSLDNLAAAAGIDFNYIAAGIDLTIGQTQALLANNGELINQYQNEINIIQSVVASLQNLISSYQGAQAAAIAAAAAARELYEAANGAAAAVNNMMNALSGGGGGGGGSTGGGDGGSSGGTSGNNNLSASDIEGIAGNIWVYGDWGNNPTRYSTMVEKFGQENGTAIYQAVQDKFNSGYGYNGGLEHDWDYYKKFSPSAYATGGYTGDWAGEGKLGILHQKELVLNDEDTANILDAVKIIRTIAAKAAGVGVSLSDMSTNTGTVGYGESIEQSVHIDAQFPNVTNSDEIQNAFNDLMNMASQYANANRRKK